MKTQDVDSNAGDVAPPEREMDEKEVEIWREKYFPPWSVPTLLIWSIGWIVLHNIVSFMCGAASSLANIWFGLGLNIGELLFIGILFARFVSVGMLLVFIVYQLRRTSSSLSDVWISYRVKPSFISIVPWLGALLMLLWAVTARAITGQFFSPPASHIQLDWHLGLGATLLVNALLLGVVEEIFYRGLIYRGLRKRISPGLAMLYSTILFAASHTDLRTDPVGIMFVFIFGLGAAALFDRTRSLNSCIFFHISFNATGTMVYFLKHIIPT